MYQVSQLGKPKKEPKKFELRVVEKKNGRFLIQRNMGFCRWEHYTLGGAIFTDKDDAIRVADADVRMHRGDEIERVHWESDPYNSW